ncbi:MAG: cytochrome P450 [Pseudomonadota bacterium]
MSDTDQSLFDAQTLIDPYPYYRKLRDEQPVHYEPALDIHVITRYDMVREALRDTETFSSRFDGFLQQSQRMMFKAASPQIQQQLIELNSQMLPLPPTMLTLDEPEHSRYRSLVNQLFTAGQIRAAQPAVEAVVGDALDQLCGTDKSVAGPRVADFIDKFANPVPLRIIADRLGIPMDAREFFYAAATEAAGALRLTPLGGEQLVARARTALGLQELLIEVIEARRSEPQEDMISILANSRLADEDRLLTHGECISILNQFLVAGHETTSSAMGWGMLLLCQQPELQRQLRGDDKAIKVFCEEVLRLEAPVQGLPRVVTRDTRLGDYDLPAGAMVMLRFGAANRDERQFPQADEVDIHRRKAGAQLAFGAGVHFCIGAPLARQELQVGFAALLERGRDFALREDAPPPQSEVSFVLRNLPELHIRFETR